MMPALRERPRLSIQCREKSKENQLLLVENGGQNSFQITFIGGDRDTQPSSRWCRLTISLAGDISS